jgi:hypothetical protein
MNMQPTRIELLQRMPVFGAIREDVLQDLLASARELVVRSGDYFSAKTTRPIRCSCSSVDVRR